MTSIAILGHGDEEAHKKQDDNQSYKGNGIFECSPEALSKCLTSLLCSDLIILFVPKVGEGYDDETQQSIQGEERVVDNLKRQEDLVNLLLICPIFAPT